MDNFDIYMFISIIMLLILLFTSHDSSSSQINNLGNTLEKIDNTLEDKINSGIKTLTNVDTKILADLQDATKIGSRLNTLDSIIKKDNENIILTKPTYVSTLNISAPPTQQTSTSSTAEQFANNYSLNVDGLTTTNNLTVNNNANITGQVRAGTANITGEVEAGTANITGQVIAGSAQINANAQISGDLTVNGNINFFRGIIVMWYGPVTSIPRGWAPCDGGVYRINPTTGIYMVSTGPSSTPETLTPDLRDRFILGGDPTNRSLSVMGGSATSNFTLTQDNIPSHTHSISWSNVGCAGTYCGSSPTGNRVKTSVVTSNNPSDASWITATNTDPLQYPHTTGGTATATPSAVSINIMPPYYRLLYIIKL